MLIFGLSFLAVISVVMIILSSAKDHKKEKPESFVVRKEEDDLDE